MLEGHEQKKETKNRLGNVTNKYDDEIISLIEKAFTQLTETESDS